MRQMLTEMQACLKQLCGIAALGQPERITEKFGIKQAQPEVLYGEENPVDRIFLLMIVALLASTTAAAADHSQDWLPSKPYFA